jgi:hypothetical protein
MGLLISPDCCRMVRQIDIDRFGGVGSTETGGGMLDTSLWQLSCDFVLASIPPLEKNNMDNCKRNTHLILDQILVLKIKCLNV